MQLNCSDLLRRQLSLRPSSSKTAQALKIFGAVLLWVVSLSADF
jgi:hypothetical protein